MISLIWLAAEGVLSGMSAHRVCACGAELEVAGDALICRGCGARARTWRVLLEGKAVAVGTLPDRIAFNGKAAVAFTPRFEAQLLALLEGPAQPLHYAIPSSWRRGHRKRQLARQ